jgi:monoamine oxidase
MSRRKHDVDVCFVGGGISSMYAADCTLRMCPTARVAVLEGAQTLGGRLRMGCFWGRHVVKGAGVVRLKQDKLLTKLAKGLKVDLNPFPKRILYAKNVEQVDVKKVWSKLEKMSRNMSAEERARDTFRTFGTRILGKRAYERLIRTIGYTDYEKADVIDTVLDYGVKDVFNSGGKFAGIDWDQLITSLVKRVGAKNVHVECPVLKVEPMNNGKWLVHTKNEQQWICNQVVFGIPIPAISKLIDVSTKCREALNSIPTQPFLRVYAKMSKASAEILANHVQGYTVVKNDLQKVIPIDSNRGIYMIAYSDNKHALRAYKERDNKMWFENKLMEAFGITSTRLQIRAMKVFFHRDGTHYFSPLNQAYENRDAFLYQVQNPLKDVFIVGESVSRNQGWTEGALESVQAVLTRDSYLHHLHHGK